MTDRRLYLVIFLFIVGIALFALAFQTTWDATHGNSTPMQKCVAAGLHNCHYETDTDGSTSVYGRP